MPIWTLHGDGRTGSQPHPHRRRGGPGGQRREHEHEHLGDDGPDGRWRVPEADTLHSLLARLHEGGRRTEQILREAAVTDHAAIGGRFDNDPPTVLWICFHVLQEYARHAGHLDVVRELIDGATGEN